MTKDYSRRTFLKQLGLFTGYFVLGINTNSGSIGRVNASGLRKHEFNVFLKIGTDDRVIIIVSRSEMGQGVRSSLPAIVADELEADLNKVIIEQGLGDKKYGDQNTDGSTSVRLFYQTLRNAGASAKMMLITAAAKRWNVNENECYAKENYVCHSKSGKNFSYGELAEEASKLSLPRNPKLKPRSDFKYIGTELKNVDIEDMVTGRAVFGLDVVFPKMLYAAIKRCPVVDGNLKSFNAEKALRIKGVKKVTEIRKILSPFSPIGGVAVVADNTWSAFKARDLIEVEWDYGGNSVYNSPEFAQKMKDSLQKKGSVVRSSGDIDFALKNAETVVESFFHIPHLAHATMEPPTAVASVKSNRCEIWAPTQDPQRVQEDVSGFLGIRKEDVKVNVTLLGGGFGRKSKPDFILEAVALSKEMKLPVKVTWSREDDIRHDFYHTVSTQYLKAGFDKNGKVTSWLHRAAFPTIASTFVKFLNTPLGFEVGQGMTNLPYDIKNISCEVASTNSHVRIGWFRSVCNVFLAFSVNVFVDELAFKAGKDPLDFRLELIGNDREIEFDNPEFKLNTERLKYVLKKVAENAGWGKKLPPDHAMGIAVHYSFYSYAAEVVEVSHKDGKIKVEKVFCVLDCGTVVNKDAVKAQMEGSIIFALSFSLYGNITVKNGQVEQSNFDDYSVLRINETPEIEVELIENDFPPSGAGEPGVPPLAPALVNAIHAATGKRYNNLPLEQYDIIS